MSDYQRVRVLRSAPAAEGIHLLVLDDAAFAAAYASPGQYGILRLPDGRKAYFARLSAPGEPDAEYLLGHGAVAEELARLGAGDTVESSPPQGRGFDLERARGLDLLFVSTGTGLGPVRATLAWLTAEPARRAPFGRLELVHGARTPEHVPVRDALGRLERAGVQTTYVYSRHGDAPGYVQDHLERRDGDLSRTAIVACGQREMIEALRSRLLRHGLDPERVLLNF